VVSPSRYMKKCAEYFNSGPFRQSLARRASATTLIIRRHWVCVRHIAAPFTCDLPGTPQVVIPLDIKFRHLETALRTMAVDTAGASKLRALSRATARKDLYVQR
jgi:hypothetical protein